MQKKARPLGKIVSTMRQGTDQWLINILMASRQVSCSSPDLCLLGGLRGEKVAVYVTKNRAELPDFSVDWVHSGKPNKKLERKS